MNHEPMGTVKDCLSNHLPPCKQISVKDLQQTSNSIFLSVNIRGIRNNVSILKELLDNFDKPSVKIIAVSESYEIDSTLTNNILEEYTLITKVRKENPSRGGCGIFIHSSLQFEEIETDQSFIEGNFETVTIKIPTLKAVFTSIYRPNGHRNSCPRKFTEHLTKHIRAINAVQELKKYSHYYLGDFNIDLNKPEMSITRDYIDSLVTNLYIPSIDANTRITNHSKKYYGSGSVQNDTHNRRDSCPRWSTRGVRVAPTGRPA